LSVALDMPRVRHRLVDDVHHQASHAFPRCRFEPLDLPAWSLRAGLRVESEGNPLNGP
jgi:hypothetical protein